MLNVISIDLEDRYHICGVDDVALKDKHKVYNCRLENSVEKILSLLERHSIHATFFTVGAIAEDMPELIKRISDAGHELATHGFAHRRIFDMTPDEFERDLTRSKIAIEKASGKEVIGYRAPEWSLKKNTLWALEILKKHGFKYDASAVPLTHLSGRSFGLYPYEIETKYGPITEFPLSTFRCLWERLPFSGGLPMRINPYFHILDNTRIINSRGYPVMFYLHPWELDTEHEKIDLPINRKFMHYFNLRSTEKKFNLLLDRFEFSTVRNVLESCRTGDQHGVFQSSKKKCYDVQYFRSIISTIPLVTLIYAFFMIVAVLFGVYSLSLIVIFSTIFYWPWGVLFRSKK